MRYIAHSEAAEDNVTQVLPWSRAGIGAVPAVVEIVAPAVAQADARYAALAGSGTQVFSAADPTLAQHVVTKTYGESHFGVSGGCQVRLSLSSTLPVPTADLTGATHVYCLPYTGRKIRLWDTTHSDFIVDDIGSGGLSLDLSGKASGMYDVFASDLTGLVRQ